MKEKIKKIFKKLKRRKIIGAIISIILIVLTVFALIGGFNVQPCEEAFKGFAQNRINYMKQQGIIVKDASECPYSYSCGCTAMGSFGTFIYEVLKDGKIYGGGTREVWTWITNRTVYVSWIEIADGLEIPIFFFLWTTNKTNAGIYRTNYTPIFDVKLDNLEFFQPKVNAYIQPYISALENAGITIMPTNDTLEEDDIWIEWHTPIEDFIKYAEVSGCKIVYLGSVNVTQNLQRPILFYRSWGIKFLYFPLT